MRQSLDESYGKKKSKAPIIIGVVIGGIVLVAIVIAVLFFVLKKEDPKPSSDSVNTDITEPSENEILNDVDYNLLMKMSYSLKALLKRQKMAIMFCAWKKNILFTEKIFTVKKFCWKMRETYISINLFFRKECSTALNLIRR